MTILCEYRNRDGGNVSLMDSGTRSVSESLSNNPLRTNRIPPIHKYIGHKFSRLYECPLHATIFKRFLHRPLFITDQYDYPFYTGLLR
ncbi:hypothetical protein D3C78_1599180 [compost metagenome]